MNAHAFKTKSNHEAVLIFLEKVTAYLATFQFDANHRSQLKQILNRRPFALFGAVVKSLGTNFLFRFGNFDSLVRRLFSYRLSLELHLV